VRGVSLATSTSLPEPLRFRNYIYSLLNADVSRLVVESLSQADSVFLSGVSRPRLPSAVKVWIRDMDPLLSPERKRFAWKKALARPPP
jgi:hypothetical protein